MFGYKTHKLIFTPIRLLTRPRELFSSETKKGIITLIDQGIVSLTNFLTGVIIGRTCSKEELGLYALGFSIVLVFTSLQTSLISTPYMVYCPRFSELEQASYTGSTLVHQLLISIFAIISLIGTTLILLLGIGPHGLAPVMGALALTITFILIREYARRVLFGLLKFEQALIIDILATITQIGSLVILSRMDLLSARCAYIVIGMSCGLAAVLYFFLHFRKFFFIPKRIFSDFKLNWRTGKWDLAAVIATVGAVQLYPWFMAAFHGIDAAGILAACFGLSYLANPLIFGLANYLGPKTMHAFAEGGIDQVRRMVNFIIAVFIVLMGLYSILMIIWGEELLQLIYGSKYAGFGLVVGLLALGKSAEVMSLGFHCGFYALEKVNIVFKAQIILLIISLTIGLYFLKAYGPVGVAYGLITGSGFTAIYKWWSYRKLIVTSSPTRAS